MMSDSTNKQFRVTLNTEEGTTEWESPIIKGKLDCFIINSTQKVSITIESPLGYMILHNAEHIGSEYYAPRAVLRAWKQYHYNVDNFNKFNLNEPLVFRVSGAANSDVVIVTRWV